MTRFNLRSLNAGDRVTTGYRSHRWQDQFLGFSREDARETVLWANAGEMFEATGSRSFSELDAAGTKVYAVFAGLDGGGVWSAYRFHGRWCAGTSADPLRVSAPETEGAGA